MSISLITPPYTSIITDKNCLVVESNSSTTYIDVLLAALFYKPSYLEHIFLNNTPKSPEFFYVQELIKHQFVESVQSNIGIPSCHLNFIKIVMFLTGWKQLKELIKEHDLIEFYEYLSDKLNIVQINLSDTVLNKIVVSTQNYIDSVVHLKTLLEKQQQYITNAPIIVPIQINRQAGTNTRIDIPRKIRIDTQSVDYKEAECSNFSSEDEKCRVLSKQSETVSKGYQKFRFHSAVCKNSSGYYALIERNNVWYIYNSLNLQATTVIDIKNSKLMEQIQSECMLLFYCAPM